MPRRAERKPKILKELKITIRPENIHEKKLSDPERFFVEWAVRHIRSMIKEEEISLRDVASLGLKGTVFEPAVKMVVDFNRILEDVYKKKPKFVSERTRERILRLLEREEVRKELLKIREMMKTGFEALFVYSMARHLIKSTNTRISEEESRSLENIFEHATTNLDKFMVLRDKLIEEYPDLRALFWRLEH